MLCALDTYCYKQGRTAQHDAAECNNMADAACCCHSPNVAAYPDIGAREKNTQTSP
jgi:hypothetical protein